MQQNNIHVLPEDENIRVDAFLARNLPDLSRNAIQRAIESGDITFASGDRVKKNHVTRAGDVFVLTFSPPEPITLVPEDIPLTVMYEDDAIIVVDKPRGMVVHPAPGHPGGTLVNALMHHCGDSLAGIGGKLRPGILHRLDKDTSGLLVVAKHDRALVNLAEQMRAREITRVYEAVTIGRIGKDEGTIDKPIGRHPADRMRMSVTAKVARDATTHFRVIARYPAHTHVRCTLETGRTHQIRVHLASIGHPVLGDLIYGRKKPERGLSGQCLHARHLAFVHPDTGAPMAFTSDLPQYFQDALGKLGAIT